MKHDDDFFTGSEIAITGHAAALVVSEAWRAVAEHGRFTLALSGGRTPAGLYRKLASGVEPELPDRHGIPTPEPAEAFQGGLIVMPWTQTFLFWGDERCVSGDHPDSNYRMAREALLDAPATEGVKAFRMPCDDLPPHEAAKKYEHTIRSILGDTQTPESDNIPVFDFILLGLGEDGHTASLFPGDRGALEETRRLVVAVTPALATPPVSRLTMTLPLINRAKTICFFTSGTKRAAMAEAIRRKTAHVSWPARLVRPLNGRMVWFISLPSPDSPRRSP